MRAVESPEPDASKSCIGFHAQMNTSDSCPVNTVTLELGISSVFIELNELGVSALMTFDVDV
jgi:hypothetical protein